MQAKQNVCLATSESMPRIRLEKNISTLPHAPPRWPRSLSVLIYRLLLIKCLLLLPLCEGLVLVLVCVLNFNACFQIFLLKKRADCFTLIVSLLS